MNEKQTAKATTRVVRESMHRMDPYSLLSGGSPADEYDSEILSITSKIQRCRSGEDVAGAIAAVLNKSLSESLSSEVYEEEGALIYEALVELGVK